MRGTAALSTRAGLCTRRPWRRFDHHSTAHSSRSSACPRSTRARERGPARTGRRIEAVALLSRHLRPRRMASSSKGRLLGRTRSYRRPASQARAAVPLPGPRTVEADPSPPPGQVPPAPFAAARADPPDALRVRAGCSLRDSLLDRLARVWLPLGRGQPVEHGGRAVPDARHTRATLADHVARRPDGASPHRGPSLGRRGGRQSLGVLLIRC